MRDRLTLFDASELALAVMGDSIFSNMMVFGAAWQNGLIPVSHAAILKSIELNGAAVDANRRAFEIGRWAALDPAQAVRVTEPRVLEKPKTLEERIAFRERHLTAYQNRKLARRYRALVDSVEDPRLREAVALGYHKLLAYKDEYEVARLHRETRARAAEHFDGDLRLTYHLAPPVMSRQGSDGRPAKRRFGAWIERLWPMLAAGKMVRGTWADPFARSEERRMERGLIRQYEADMVEVLGAVTDRTRDAAVALAELPLQIRGFGPVKSANSARAEKRREELLATIRAGGPELARAAE